MEKVRNIFLIMFSMMSLYCRSQTLDKVYANQFFSRMVERGFLKENNRSEFLNRIKSVDYANTFFNCMVERDRFSDDKRVDFIKSLYPDLSDSAVALVCAFWLYDNRSCCYIISPMGINSMSVKVKFYWPKSLVHNVYYTTIQDDCVMMLVMGDWCDLTVICSTSIDAIKSLHKDAFASSKHIRPTRTIESVYGDISVDYLVGEDRSFAILRFARIDVIDGKTAYYIVRINSMDCEYYVDEFVSNLESKYSDRVLKELR